MDFIEKVGNVISEKGREAVDKTRILAEIMSLKSQIATCQEVIKKNYLEIGKLYYEEYRDVEDAPFEKQREAITNARKGEEELQAKDKELYDLKHELISAQIKLESSQEQVKALQKEQNESAKELVRLETELKKK